MLYSILVLSNSKMRILFFSILCFVAAEVSSLKTALLFNLETGSLDDPCRENGYTKCPPYLTACPAATSRERQFNQNMSIGKRSLFSRVFYAKDEYAKNIEIDICENRIKPTMLYDTLDEHYEIGYELYFEDGKVNMTDETYHYRYKPVNITNPKFYEVLDVSLPTSDGFVTKFEYCSEVEKFNFTDENKILGFHWIEVLSIKNLESKKRVDGVSPSNFDHLRDKCSNYRSDDDELYSEENQKKSLSSISALLSVYNENRDMECGQPYGCLEKSQIVPLWYFNSRSARLASCSHMNLIPVWKSIVEQLRRVDLYINSVYTNFDSHNLIYGISGTLKLKVPIATLAGVSEKLQKMYLSDSAISHKKVPIPEILYRIIQVTSLKENYDKFTAAIIIHNDPSADPEKKICSYTLSGWDMIENSNATTGLTYVCEVTEDLNDKLGAFDNLGLNEFTSLNLDSVPYYRSSTYPEEFSDETYEINRDFESLLEQI